MSIGEYAIGYTIIGQYAGSVPSGMSVNSLSCGIGTMSATCIGNWNVNEVTMNAETKQVLIVRREKLKAAEIASAMHAIRADVIDRRAERRAERRTRARANK